MEESNNDKKLPGKHFRSGPIRVVLPPNLTNTSYSMWLTAKKEARAERDGKVETISMWLAPAPVRKAEAETGGRLSRDGDNNENTGESLVESVRRGLLRAGSQPKSSIADDSPSSQGAESLADRVRAGLLLAGARDDWVVPEASGDEDMEDDSSIVTLDTVTDSSLDMEQFDVMEDTAPLLATWIAK